MADSRLIWGFFGTDKSGPLTWGWFTSSTPPTPTEGGPADFLVTDGMRSRLLVTDGFGCKKFSYPVPVFGKGIYVVEGDSPLAIDIILMHDRAYLTYKDSNNSFIKYIPFSASKLSGVDWTLLKISRSGSNLILSYDGETVWTKTLDSVATISGTHKLGVEKEVGMFDIRTIPQSINDATHEYYNRTVREKGGDSLLPVHEFVQDSTPETAPADPVVETPPSEYTLCLDGGGFVLRAYVEAGVGKLFIHDGDGDHTIDLPLTAEQLDGGWGFLKVTRTGHVIAMTFDKEIVYSYTLPAGPLKVFGNKLYLGKGMNQGLFDVRVIPESINKATSDYYQDNILVNGGDTLLPSE